MRRPVPTHQSDYNHSTIDEKKGLPPRSYTGMILSAIVPGLGQLYLHRVLKGFIVFFVFLSALILFYLNSYPVRDWSDLLSFQPSGHSSGSGLFAKEYGSMDIDNAIQLWTFDDGKSLWFRPSFLLKITAMIQAIFCWIYATYDAWRVEREIDIRSYQKELTN